VLEDWDLPRLRINFAYPTCKHLSAKVRSFIAFIAADFKANDYAERWTRMPRRSGPS
jgi:hypothetical protein